ncbi:MAG: vitamin K epoxide reductase family protein [Verrucomicrobiia bacterium]|jgi:uncharacterized membrane protein
MSEKMDSDNSSQPEIPSTPAWLLWTRALLVVAMLGAGYLAWLAIHNGPAAGCGPESGCNAVLQSRWAYWLDLPVSVPAVLVYLALLGVTVLLQKRPSPDEQRGSWAAIIILAVIMAGAALWFVGLQVFVIKAFCKFCMTAHACGFAAALLCLKNIPLAADPDTPMWTAGSGKRGVPRQAVLSLVLIGLAGVAVLAGGQILFQKQRNVVKGLPVAGARAITTAASPSSASTNLSASGGPSADQPASPNARLIAPRTLSLYSNQFLIRFDDVPMIGSPDSPHIIVYLFDYTCSHCRAVHPILVQACQQFSNQLGVVCLPMSLSPQCNPFIPRVTSHATPNSCEYARLGLAVWRAKPEAQRQFDEWMFATVKPPPLEQARDYAAQLVGEDKLKSALADPWIQQQILTDCRLHHANWLAVDSSAMPQIIMGDAVSSGPLNSVGHLVILLNRYLGMDLEFNRH